MTLLSQAGRPKPSRRWIRSANRSLLLVSGGGQAGDEAMLEKPRQSMDAGATGLIFGRNVFHAGTPNRSGSSPS